MMAEYSEEVPRLNVSLAMSESTPPKALDPCNVFVKYLPSALDDAELAKLFGSFGRILSSKIMVDPTSRKSLGFGYV
jgi:RNA recognition motif-containing protein